MLALLLSGCGQTTVTPAIPPGGAGAADLCVGAGAARADGVHLGGVR